MKRWNGALVSRRELLLGASIAALMASSSSMARPLRGGGVTLPTGTSQLGAFPSGASIFMNFAKGLGDQGSSANFQSLINADGYPAGSLSSSSGYILVSAIDATQIAPTVTWVCDWQGKGGLLLENGTTFGNPNFTITNIGAGTTIGGVSTVPTTITGNLVASGTNGYFEFTNGSGATQFLVNFNASIIYDGTMSNLRIYRKSDQTALNAGGIFLPELISLIQTLNPKTLRCMDWSGTNSSNISRYSYRTPTTALSYQSDHWKPTLWGGTSTNSGDAYTIANPSGSPASGTYQDGETVQWQANFQNTTTTPTLTIAGRTGGAVPIQLNYASAVSAGTISVGTCCTSVYDAWLNVWLTDFSTVSANNNGGGLTVGAPIEILVALCNLLNLNLWYNIPFHYDNSSVTSVAAYVAANLNSNLTAYFEFSNEVWNTTIGFAQTQLAAARGVFLGFPSSNNRHYTGYYGLRVAQIMPLVTAAWNSAGRSLSTLKRVMALWMDDASPSTLQTYRMNGGDLSTSLGYPNYNAVVGQSYNVGSPTFSRPIDQCDVVAYAPYYAGAVINNGFNYSSLNATDVSFLTTAANNYAAGGASATTALQWMDDDIRRGRTSAQTVTVASNIFTGANAAPSAGTAISFYTSGTPFTGLTYSNIYYVINPSGNTFQVSATFGGSAVTGISGGSGTQIYGLLGGETLLWILNFYYATSNARGFGWSQIAASYNGARPSGASNLTIEGYEAALEAKTLSTQDCTNLGISTTYGGTGGLVDNMITGYKNSSLAFQLVQDQFNQFITTSKAQGVSFVAPVWYNLQAPGGLSQWSLMPGDTFSAPYQLYYGIKAFN